jgi:predicted metal-dependent peptidase
MAAQHPKLASDSLEKIPDNIAVSFLPDFESLSKKALEKGLNYFTQGYVHDPLCRMDNGIYCLSFELALKLYERKTTKI